MENPRAPSNDLHDDTYSIKAVRLYLCADAGIPTKLRQNSAPDSISLSMCV